MLEVIVFFSGALVMALEMTGGRVLAPYVGTSAIVWTSLIGVVLAFLAAGAWAGGKFADKKLSRAGLAQALAGAGIGCAITAFGNVSIGATITNHITNLYAGAVIAAICIFALPAFFFGMITPYVIRLSLATLKNAGATVGRLYALSTAGSILGTFLGGFFLISYFSSTLILWAIACAMLILSLLSYYAKPWLRLLLLALFIFFCWQDLSYANWLADKNGTRLIESPYNSIRLMEGIDNSRGNARVRLMATDPGYSQSGMLIDDPNDLYFDYTRFYALGPEYVPDAKSVLMLGGGGYSVPKWLLTRSPLADNADLRVKTVELDRAMTDTAYKYFALPKDSRLSIQHEDARAFLNRQTDQYDLVFVDVFNSFYSIPFQMGTAEAVKAMANAVKPDGALMMNIISAIEGEDGRLFQAIYQNILKEFADVRVYCVGNPAMADKVQNLMVLAFKQKQEHPRQLHSDNRELENMQKHLYNKPVNFTVPPLRDDYAPVERYSLMLTKD